MAAGQPEGVAGTVASSADWSGLPYVVGAVIVALLLREWNAAIGNMALVLVFLVLAVAYANKVGWVHLPAHK